MPMPDGMQQQQHSFQTRRPAIPLPPLSLPKSPAKIVEPANQALQQKDEAAQDETPGRDGSVSSDDVGQRAESTEMLVEKMAKAREKVDTVGSWSADAVLAIDIGQGIV